MIVCTKSWFDGLLGRPYGWHKTPRTGTARSARSTPPHLVPAAVAS